MIKAIIFDFDGVLVESSHIKTEAFRKIFSRWPDKVDEGMTFHLINMGVSRYIKFKYFYENIIKEPYSDEIGFKLGREFSNIVFDEIKQAPLVKGTEAFLENYCNRYNLFIASGTPEEELQEIVYFKGINKYFADVFGSPLTKTEVIKKILRRNLLKSNTVVFIGDAESDRKAAEDTEVHFVLRTTSENHDIGNSCKYKISSLTRLRKIIKEIGQ